MKNGPHITKIVNSLSASESVAVSPKKPVRILPAAKHAREQESVKRSFSHLLLAGGQKTLS